MKTVQLQQGTPEWQQWRASRFTASDAPTMLGINPYKTRDALLREKATGQAPEIDSATAALFAEGHRAEALARTMVEKIIDDDLFPVVAEDDDGQLAASFDGMTLDGDTLFEHKLMNDALRACRDEGAPIPEHYRAQMEQQLMVSGAREVLFVASAWNDDGTPAEEPFHGHYESDPAMRARIIAGWQQFAEDLKNWQPAEVAPEGKAPETLPALHIQLTGQVTASNLGEFKAHALAVIGTINTDLQTDNDFADAEKTVKWCKEVEARLAAAKEAALGQTASIDALFRALDEISETARRTRLNLEKQVKAKKDEIRLAKIREAAQRFSDAVAARVQELGVNLPVVAPDFAGAIRGLKTLASIDNALAATLTDAIAAAGQLFDCAQSNQLWLSESEARNLPTFPDLAQLLIKPKEDFQAIVKGRVEEARAAAERMRAEEEARQAEAARQAEEAQAAAEAQAQAQPVPVPEAAPVQEAPEAPPVAPSGKTMKLGEINERIAPVTITRDALAWLGFSPVGKERAAYLYDAAAFPRICEAIARHVLACITKGAKAEDEQ